MYLIRDIFLKKLLFIVSIGTTASSLYSQQNPPQGDTLNYTNILFSFPQQNHAENYLIEISEAPTFSQKTLVETDINAHLVSSFNFGKNYFWHYAAIDAKGNSLGWSDTFSFVIGSNPYTNNEFFRYQGKKKDRSKAKPGVLFMDYGRVAVNRAGKVIWYLLDYPFLQGNELVRDIKLTPEGTITGLIDSVACEMDLNGTILWRAPDNGMLNGEKSENYHHDLKKLPSGNYMVLGTDMVSRIIPGTSDSIEVGFGTVIEYDVFGNIVWSWNSNTYFTDKDLFSKRRRDGSYDVMTHMNAFSTDGKHVVVGFRDLSRIVVIDKNTAKVTESYGAKGLYSEPHSGIGLFRRQHDATVLRDGNYAVVNNDSIMDPSVVSSLVIFSPISKTNPVSKKVFEFKFDFDTLTNGKTPKMGNLQELDNGNILINMGGLNRCIEITRSGEVVWDMFMEKYDSLHKRWTPFPQYRVSYSSSLYPYVFRSKIMTDTVINQKRTIALGIYNVGESEDVYTVESFEKTKNFTTNKKLNSIRLAPGESGLIEVSFIESEKIHFRVKSFNSHIHEHITP